MKQYVLATILVMALNGCSKPDQEAAKVEPSEIEYFPKKLLNRRSPTTSEQLDVFTLYCRPEDKESLVAELQKL